MAVPQLGSKRVDPRKGGWRAMRLPDIDCRAMMHGASVSSNMDVASLSLLTDRSASFRRRLALTVCAAALCLAYLPAQARGPHNAPPSGFGGGNGFGRFNGGGFFEAAAPHKGGNSGAARGNEADERRRRAAAMENRRAENEGRSGPPPQRKLSPEERKQLRQNIYDVTRDIYHRGG
ncbi:hypothetical protein [Ralstonia sp. A12]|uniref:hypothetical protein n=1 Tax=Ralstonia sp. A12 TaxID=1217052 RepID=UPI001E52DA98|nr:hypothetical protein [Ralstonia sp. A12]